MMNLPEQLRLCVTEDAQLTIGDMLSEPPQRMHDAIHAAQIMLLLALAHKSSHPDGARIIRHAIDERDTSILDHFAEDIRGTRIFAVMERGSEQFVRILGREVSDAMAGAIQRFSGMSISSSHSLLSSLMPPVLAALGRHAPSQDASGIAALLARQRENIAAEMPAGLASAVLQFPELSFMAVHLHAYDEGMAATSTDDDMEGYSATHRQEIVPALHGSNELHHRPARMSDHARSSEWDKAPGTLAWVIPLLLLAALLAGLIYFMMPGHEPAGPRGAVTAETGVMDQELQALPAAAEMTAEPSAHQQYLMGDLGFLGDPSLALEIASAFAQLSTILDHVQGAQEARAAEPAAATLAKRFQLLEDRISALDAPRKGELSRKIKARLPAIQMRMDQIGALVGSQPVVASLRRIEAALQRISQ